jgi:hypothetical protein
MLEKPENSFEKEKKKQRTWKAAMMYRKRARGAGKKINI